MRISILITTFVVLTLNACTQPSANEVLVQKDTSQIKKHELNSALEFKEPKLIKFNSKYSFDQFKTKKHTGNLTSPNFEENPFRNDTSYVNFISNGCKENGVNFGGKYTILTMPCGMECTHLFIIDRASGEVFTDINLAEGRSGFEFRPNSRMLLANSSVFKDKNFKYYEEHYHWQPEIYEWKDNTFKKINLN